MLSGVQAGYSLDELSVYCRPTKRDKQPSALTIESWQTEPRLCTVGGSWSPGGKTHTDTEHANSTQKSSRTRNPTHHFLAVRQRRHICVTQEITFSNQI